MKKHIILLTAFAVSAFATQAQYWNDTGNPGVIPGTNFLGSTNNAPVDFRTANLFRARINPKISYAIGTAPVDARNGFMLLSGRDNFPQQMKGPFSRLHLVDDAGSNAPIVYAQDIGFRNWMRNGITFTGNSDQAYIGQKYKGNDNTDFVIQWSTAPSSFQLL